MRNSSGTFFYAIFFLLCYTSGFSQPTLVNDINTSVGSVQQAGDYNKFFFRCGSYLYFRVQDEAGAEVWRTDGTPSGTLRVTDLNKGFKDGTTPFDFACLNNFLIYAGENGESGMELWRTNGQVNIVQRIKDIRPGESSSVPHNFIEFGGKVYFFIQGSDASKLELWQTTGAEGGTLFITEIVNADKTTVHLTATGQNFFYFTCLVTNSTTSESQLWRSDGTSTGTTMLKGESFLITYPTAVNDKLFFVNFNVDGYQLWITDGTEPGTVQVKDFGFESPQDLFAFNNNLIFSANGIWITDGTGPGTLNLATGYITAGVVYNTMFYGVGADNSSGTNFLLRTNGMIGNTEKIVTLDGFVGDLTIRNEIPVLADKFILPVYTTETGQEIGITDRTQVGTQQVKDIFPGVNGSEPRAWMVFNNKVFFLADDGTHGTELWVSDGTAPGTSLLKDCRPGTENSVSDVSANLEVLNNKVYFLASTSTVANTDLWQSNGTDVGTSLYYDFDTSPFFIGRKNSELYYFSANKVFKSNGLLNGTTLVKDLSSQLGGYDLNPHKPILVGDKLIFYFSTFAGPADFGGEYWVTDGTESGTKILKDINAGASSGIVNPVGINLNNSYLFSADNGSTGQELWITNGTEAGTTLLKDLNTGGSSSPSAFALLNGKAFFSADDGINGRELWQTDGTSLGTTLLNDIVASTPGSSPKFLTTVGNIILFTAYDETRGWALWKTDGTSNGTTFVKDIYPGTEIERYPTNLTESNGKLFFSMNDGTNGNELWVSDGTDAGTIMLSVVPGAASSNPSMITTIQGITYFRANGELWRTNGTPQHTERVAALDPFSIAYNDGWIYFTSVTASYGAELYKIQFTKFSQTITLPSIPVKVLGDAPFAVVATSSSNLPVSLSAGNSKITLNNNEVTLVSAGSATIKANQSGNTTFAAAVEASQTFCINPPKPVIAVSGSIMAPLLTSSNNDGNSWFLNGVLVTGATEKTLLAEETGTYTVQTSIDNCMSVLSDPLAVTVTGIEEHDFRITVHPNPATQAIRIEINGFSGTGTIQLTDLTGKVIDTYSIAPGESIVDHTISNYPPAMYLVKVAVQDAVIFKKFVKQ